MAQGQAKARLFVAAAYVGQAPPVITNGQIQPGLSVAAAYAGQAPSVITKGQIQLWPFAAAHVGRFHQLSSPTAQSLV